MIVLVLLILAAQAALFFAAGYWYRKSIEPLPPRPRTPNEQLEVRTIERVGSVEHEESLRIIRRAS